jgi:hypothetical protein
MSEAGIFTEVGCFEHIEVKRYVKFGYVVAWFIFYDRQFNMDDLVFDVVQSEREHNVPIYVFNDKSLMYQVATIYEETFLKIEDVESYLKELCWEYIHDWYIPKERRGW